jgi:hypothetical protein
MLIASIILEAAVALVAVLAARHGRPYLYGLAFTFAAYVLYDFARLMQWAVEGRCCRGCFWSPPSPRWSPCWGCGGTAATVSSSRARKPSAQIPRARFKRSM